MPTFDMLQRLMFESMAFARKSECSLTSNADAFYSPESSGWNGNCAIHDMDLSPSPVGDRWAVWSSSVRHPRSRRVWLPIMENKLTVALLRALLVILATQVNVMIG